MNLTEEPLGLIVGVWGCKSVIILLSNLWIYSATISGVMYLIFPIAFLVLMGITLVIVGGWVLFFAREIKISTRLIDFLFLGPLLAAIKAATSDSFFYRLTDRNKNILACIFIIAGCFVLYVAWQVGISPF